MGALDRVLFIVWGFPEPTQTFIFRELSEMAARGESVKILASHRVDNPGAKPEIQRMADEALYLGSPLGWALGGLVQGLLHPIRVGSTLLWVARLPHRSWWHRLRAMGLVIAAASIARRVEQSGATYLHAHFAHHAELAMALGKLCDLPWGATFHAVGIWRERNLLKEKVEQARVIMTCTEKNRTELLRHAPGHEDSVHLVYHGLEAHLFERATTPAGQCSDFLAVGRLVEKKGLDVLLSALSEMPAPRPTLKIIGDGPLRGALEIQARESGIGDSVLFLGNKTNAEVLEEMATCRCLVQPSVVTKAGDVDGIPNVILEAMALSRPVIGSDVSGIPEVVIEEETGLLVLPRDAPALRGALERLCGDDALCERLGAAGHALVEERFGVARAVTEQLALIERAARTPGSEGHA